VVAVMRVLTIGAHASVATGGWSGQVKRMPSRD
jgi:hypothetical protein